MKNNRLAVSVHLICFVLYFFTLFILLGEEANAQNAAQSLNGRLMVGIRGGPSFLTESICSSCGVDGETGPIVSGNIMYGVSENILLGVSIEWEDHDFSTSGTTFGDATTVSVMPTAEIHVPPAKGLSPYLTLGLGINFNSFSGNSTLNNACLFVFGSSCTISPDNTLALKIGGGLDYFINPNFSLNAEAAWKLNSGKMTVSVAGVGSEQDDYHSDVFTLLFGLRYYFR